MAEMGALSCRSQMPRLETSGRIDAVGGVFRMLCPARFSASASSREWRQEPSYDSNLHMTESHFLLNPGPGQLQASDFNGFSKKFLRILRNLLTRGCTRSGDFVHSYASLAGDQVGWGGWIRTSACRYQKPVPYRLATPQQRPAGRDLRRAQPLSKAHARSQRLNLSHRRDFRRRYGAPDNGLAFCASGVRQVRHWIRGPNHEHQANLKATSVAIATAKTIGSTGFSKRWSVHERCS